MDQELFNPQSSSVSSSRIIYTPSTFARTSLLHLQEVGSLQAVHPHISQRSDLVSFLCFIVLSGEGELSYEEQTYQLSEGDSVNSPDGAVLASGECCDSKPEENGTGSCKRASGRALYGEAYIG